MSLSKMAIELPPRDSVLGECSTLIKEKALIPPL
jgi:hypothetical protein